MIYIFWTCCNQEEAEKIVNQLLTSKLIGCASLFPEIKSIYRWEEKIEESIEVKVILKTVLKNFEKIEEIILANCSYEIPEIAMVKVEKCSPRYFSWLDQEVKN